MGPDIFHVCWLMTGVFTGQAEDMCSEPAINYNFDPPHLHSAVITGLVRSAYHSSAPFKLFESTVFNTLVARGPRVLLQIERGKRYQHICHAGARRALPVQNRQSPATEQLPGSCKAGAGRGVHLHRVW